MAIRKAVEDFVKLGPLPDSSAPEATIALHQVHLQRIEAPVTDEEAGLLVRLFRPYSSYELARTLLCLIETASSGCPRKVELPPETPLTHEEKRMASHKAVEDFVRLGPLPDESSASEETIELHYHHLERIIAPVTDAEAALLVKCFGPDSCYGIAWTLLHLIESAPGGIPVKTQPSASENEWIRLLWERSHR